MSDFYVPENEIAEHKIQSRDHTTLDLSLKQVPKKLGLIKSHWNPSTTLISFKLETDQNILQHKALSAISKYNVDMVIANQL